MKKIIIILALAAFTTGTFTSCMEEEVVPTDSYTLGSSEDATEGGL